MMAVENTSPGADTRTEKTRLLERLMLACRGRHALPAFFGISFLESSLLPVPIDLAMVPLGLAQPRRLWLIALVGALGSVAGALLGFMIGSLAFDMIGAWFIEAYGMSAEFDAFRAEFAETGWLAVVVAALTPIPFKFGAILAGSLSMPLHLFVGVAFGARLLRFGLMALMIRIFGAGLNLVVKKHSRGFTMLALAATVLGIVITPLII